ncbi:DUF3054 domain-containing protein [Brachybacterium sp. EF45031]|uniref:DUF3054 domain-containing protein n=1 Tax=Brachybacterium sillae TaxID=2810536 RepID=UPI00217E7705|nr:DUF3054 domain-containing protein [Brachybacterium sillae]MCS6711123.1 DUF3054 domain-containing protein [Brachybacterium sillae]
MFRALGSLVGDALAVVLFTAVGLIQHGERLTTMNLVIVAWPFLLGMLLGHLAVQAWKRPFALWPTGVFVTAITVVGGMAVRTFLGAPPQVSFVVVTSLVLALLMLGWRLVARFVTGRPQPGPAAR